MADKKLNAVSTAKDGAYIYAEDASGNQIKISKADLATVVAGMMSINLANGRDLNDIKTNGSYFVRAGTNAPGDFFHFNVLQNKNTGDLVQYGFIMRATINMYIRNFFNGAWTPWKSVNINA